MTRAESNIVLFSITLCWAASYIFIKNIPAAISPFAYVTITNGIAGLILVLVFFTRLRELDRATLRRSLILALIICGNLVLERLGIVRLPASTASFIGSLNIVLVPVLLLFFKRKPSPNHLLGIVFIVARLLCTGDRCCYAR